MKKLLFIVAIISCQKTTTSTTKGTSNSLTLNSYTNFYQPCCGYSRKFSLTYNVDTMQGTSILVLEDGAYLDRINLKKPNATIDFYDHWINYGKVTYYTFIFEHKNGTDEELGKFKTQ